MTIRRKISSFPSFFSFIILSGLFLASSVFAFSYGVKNLPKGKNSSYEQSDKNKEKESKVEAKEIEDVAETGVFQVFASGQQMQDDEDIAEGEAQDMEENLPNENNDKGSEIDGEDDPVPLCGTMLDQEQTQENRSRKQEGYQTFTAGVTGKLSKIAIVFHPHKTKPEILTLQIKKGDEDLLNFSGWSTPVIAYKGEQFVTNKGDYYWYVADFSDLDEDFYIESAQVYSFKIDGKSGKHLTSNADVYANGKYVSKNGVTKGDAAFRTYVTQQCADLSVSISDNPDPVHAGEELTYTLNIANYGPDNASSVELIINLPESINVPTVESQQGSCLYSDGTIACDIEELESGSSTTVTVVIVPTIYGAITTTASISAQEEDPFEENNTASEDTQVQINQPPVLDPIGDKEVNVDQELSFTITATDPDNDPLIYTATNLPDGAAFEGQTFTWTPTYEQAGEYEGVNFKVSDGILKDYEDITIIVYGGADLRHLGLFDDNDPVSLGDFVTYDVCIVNYGPDDAYNIVTTITLSDNLEYDHVVWGKQGTVTVEGNVVTWKLDFLEKPLPYHTVDLDIIAKAVKEGQAEVHAEITSTVYDPVPENNVETETTDIVSPEPFTDIEENGLSPAMAGSVDWGDYDNDGDLDVLLMGLGPISRVYRNDNGSFVDINAGLQGMHLGNAMWGDYDNDGDLDIVIAGRTGNDNPRFKIYRNDDKDQFVDINVVFPGYGNDTWFNEFTSWIDYDNDGDLDVLLSGQFATTNCAQKSVARILRNDGNDHFEYSGIELSGAQSVIAGGAYALGDIDNDQDTDIIVSGETQGCSPSYSYTHKVYKNEGDGTFSESEFPLFGHNSMDLGDYDNDGDLDALINGHFITPYTKVYSNDGTGSFSDINAQLPDMGGYTSVRWGDYDNDGDLDVLLAGADATKLYRNDNGNFVDSNVSLAGVAYSGAAWGDYDNDHDLDILLMGSINYSSQKTIKLYRNNISTPNTIPQAPSGLSSSVSEDTVTLSWDSASDDQTPSSGLYYNIRIGTTPGGVDILSSMSANDGYRRVVRVGNAGENTGWHIEGLAPGTYYWSVQSIDTAFAGSPFAQEGSFIVNGGVDMRLILLDDDKDPVSVGDFVTYTVAIRNDGPDTAYDIVTTITLPDNLEYHHVEWPTQDSVTVENNIVTWKVDKLEKPHPYHTITQDIIAKAVKEGQAEVLVEITSTAYDPVPENSIEIEVTEIVYGGQLTPVEKEYLQGSMHGSVDWGDYDSDGDLDILTMGYQGGDTPGPKSIVYRNNLNNFIDILAPLVDLSYGNAVWGDYDNDGDLDILMAGSSLSDFKAHLKIYKNKGGDLFEDINLVIPERKDDGIIYADWIDYDNDGYLDLVLSASFDTGSGDNPATRIYHNDGNGNFEYSGIELIQASWNKFGIGDYDNDQDTDIIIIGTYIAKAYKNEGNGTFVEDPALELPASYYSSIDLGDYDNDGDLDVLFTGNIGGMVSRIYRNDGDTFTDIQAALEPIDNGTAIWGDYDNDGDLDIFLTGKNAAEEPVSKLYRNDNGNFVDTGIPFTAVVYSDADWGDYDNDGDLDLVLVGTKQVDFVDTILQLYINNTTI